VKRMMIGWTVLACVLFASPLLDAQTQPGQEATTRRQIPLKVQLVVSRYLGEKKVSSLPYTLSVVANDNDKTSLRMGVEVPIANTVFSPATPGGTQTTPMTSFNYRSIGTNIDCSARTLEEGLFKLDLAVEDSSVFVADKDSAGLGRTPGVPAPSIRNFKSTFNLLLKDGQTATHTAATDPVSGEVLRIDVTATVLK
jgi:hypothetical protein